MPNLFLILIVIALAGTPAMAVSAAPAGQDVLPTQSPVLGLDVTATPSSEALGYFRQAQNRDVPGLMHRIGTVVPEGIRLLEKALQSDPDYHAAHYVLGLSYLRTGRLPRAEQSLFRATSLKPSDPDGHLHLGVVYTRTLKPDQAIRSLEAALALNPGDSRILFRLGEAHRAHLPAAEYFRQASEHNAFLQPVARLERIMAYSRAGAFDNILEIFRGLNSDSLGEAVLKHVRARFMELTADYGEDPAFLESYAHLFFWKGDDEDAVRYFHDALDLDISRFRSHGVLGRSLYNLARMPEAMRHLKIAVVENPSDREAWVLLGEVSKFSLNPQADYDVAIQAYRAAIDLKPQDAELYREMADAYFKKNDFGRARATLQEAIALDDQDPEAYSLLGDLHAVQGEGEQAVVQFSKAVEIYIRRGEDLSEGWTRYAMGQAREMAGQLDRALEQYQRAYEILQLQLLKDRMAKLYVRQERYDQAGAYYQDRIRRDPADLGAHLDLAVTYARWGKVSLVTETYQKILRLDPENARAHEALGLIYARVPGQRVEQALTHFRQYLEATEGLAPEGARREHARFVMAELGFPQKIEGLKIQGGDLGAVGSLLEAAWEYQAAGRQWIGVPDRVREQGPGNLAETGLFDVERAYYALDEDIGNIYINVKGPQFQDIIRELRGATRARIDAVQRFMRDLSAPRGQDGDGSVRVRSGMDQADRHFMVALKSLELIMEKHPAQFTVYDLQVIDRDIANYTQRHGD